jgi:hypothetical protein
MQFQDAVIAARRLSANGQGAEDSVILSAIADQLAELTAKVDAWVKESNLRQDGVYILSETTKNQIRTLRNRICQIDGIQDAQEQQIFHLKKCIPPKDKRAKSKDDGPTEERASS